MAKSDSHGALTIGALLEIDRRNRPSGSLPGVLGDGYLLLHNPLYRNIRKAFTASGFRFTKIDFCGYFDFPRAALPAMLRKRKAYYVDNVSILRKIAHAAGAGSIPAQVLPVHGGIRANVLLHESTHLVCRQRFSAIGKRAALSLQRRFMLDTFIDEGAACAMEILGNGFIGEEVQEQFYRVNAYSDFFLTPRERELLLEGMSELGLGGTFRLLHYGYICSLLLSDPSLEEMFDRALSSIGDRPSARARRKLLELFRVAFRLNLPFRTQTSGFYLAFVGVASSLPRLLDFDFREMLFEDRGTLGQLERMASIAELGAESPML